MPPCACLAWAVPPAGFRRDATAGVFSMRRFLVALSVPTLLTAALVGSAAAQGSGGVTDGAAFWANGQLYRTVNTPTDIGGGGAPAHSFDIIYAFPEGTQINVAEAAPGGQDYNGGRWMVTPISFT